MVHSLYTRPETVVADTTTMDPLLISLLNTCTPTTHEKYIANIVKKEVSKNYIVEEIQGNLLVKVGDAPSTMFSCHMDMIGNLNPNNVKQNKLDAIRLMEPKDNKNKGYIYGSKVILNKEGKFSKYEPCTIGADDKIGVYLMIKMIQAKIPGLYVFHVGEEAGGIGSKYLVDNYASKFEGYKRAIAFDRAGYGDVIEHQRHGRCCSTEFGKALAEALNVYMPPFQIFKSNVHGTFTDTANYIKIIPECTNISVGYFNQHGHSEYFDHVWLKVYLLRTVLDIKWDDLPVVRDPKVTTTSNVVYYGRGNYTNIMRKSWEDADKNTKNMDLPKWTPKIGYTEHNDDVLQRAIHEHVSFAYTLAEKKELSEYIYTILELIEYYDLDLKMKKDMITRLQAQLSGNPSEISEKVDEDIIKKKDFLTDLISLGDIYDLPKFDDSYKKYCKRGLNFLHTHRNHDNKENYNPAEIKRLNRTIIIMANLLSISELINDDVERVLRNIHEYVIVRMHEPGFDLAADLNKSEKKKIIEPTIDNGRSAALH